MTATPRTLVVHCDQWSIRAAGFAHDERPTAVFDASGIVAINFAAYQGGVRTGVRRRVAQGRCPELRLVPRDPLGEALAFEVVLSALDAVTPLVEVISPGLVACPTRGPSRYFGGDAALAAKVCADVGQALGDQNAIHVGIADGPIVARLAAIGARGGKTRVIPSHDTTKFLHPIPLSALIRFAPDPGVLDTLSRLGLATLGDVAALDAGTVNGRFGHEGMWVHRLAQGNDPQDLVLVPVPDNTDESVDFDPPELRAEAVAFAARVAAETFVERLAQRGVSCAQVIIGLSSDHGEVCERRWRLDGPGNSNKHTLDALIAQRVRWQVDGWLRAPVASRPTAGVIRLVLTPGEVIAAKGTQMGFWGGASATDERAARAIARLEALCGPDAVHVAIDQGGRNPGDEVTMVPTATADLTNAHRLDRLTRAAQAGRAAPHDPPWPGRLPAPSPTLVFDPPLGVSVTDPQGNSVQVTGRGEVDRHPHRVDTQQITAWAGPWPIDERWWDDTTHSRHARIQVVVDDGSALLLSRHQQRWWVHAIYR